MGDGVYVWVVGGCGSSGRGRGWGKGVGVSTGWVGRESIEGHRGI